MNATELASVCNIEMGQAPTGSSYNSVGVGLPLLAGAGDFGLDYPAASKFTSSPTKVSEPNDIIMCIRATIGDLNWSDRSYCLGRGVAGLRPKPKSLDRNYLWHWLSYARADLERKARGSTFKQVSKKDVAELEIPLPKTLEEQRRIATILDKADAIRRKREQALTLADDFLRSVFLEMFGEPTTVGNNEPTLLEVATISRGRFSPRPRNDPRYYNGDFPFIQTGEIANSVSYLSEYRQTLNEAGTKVSKSFPAGTVFIAIVGATIGATTVSTRRFWCPDSVIGIVPKSSAVPAEFIEFLLRFWRPVFVATAPSTARANINLQTLNVVRIPKADTDAPARFAEIYKRTYAFKRKLEQMDTGLLPALSQRAFAGEL